jgi:hypothetical protein
MAAAPAQIESRSTTGDPEALQFQRLERVRQRRVRRRYRLFIAAMLAITLAGAGVMGFIAIRRTSLERLGSSSSRPPAPVETVKPVVPAPALTGAVPGPPLVDVSQPQAADKVRRRETQAPRIHPEADRGPSAVAPVRDEPRDTDAVDPASAIDWLLKRHGRDATRAPNGGEEKLQ